MGWTRRAMGPTVSFAGAVRARGGAVRQRVGSRPAAGSAASCAAGRAIGHVRFRSAAGAPRVPGRGVQRAQRGVEPAHDQRALQRRAARAEHRDAHTAVLAAGGRAAVRRRARRPRASGRAVLGAPVRLVPAGDPVWQRVRSVRVARPGRRPGGAVARRAAGALAAAAGRADSPLLVEGRAQEGELRAQLLPGQPRRAPGQHGGQLALERGAPGRRACAAAAAAGRRCSAVLRSAHAGRRLAAGVLRERALGGPVAPIRRLRVRRRVGLAVALALARAGRGCGAGRSLACAGVRAGRRQLRDCRKVQHLRVRGARAACRKAAQPRAPRRRIGPTASAAQPTAPCRERRWYGARPGRHQRHTRPTVRGKR